MQRALMVTAGAALAALATFAAAQAQTRVEVGVLTCTASGSTGFIIGSTRELPAPTAVDDLDSIEWQGPAAR